MLTAGRRPMLQSAARGSALTLRGSALIPRGSALTLRGSALTLRGAYGCCICDL